ncbi:hypothetical protein [Halostella sp. PRR32]|uniref:hypothetical protein n=1 Tax=Halostella sp. PRR32 TaxID=3098147 RepID=UPI002B1E61A5|nr:hypothetical protein [Halostella sp. PRR32]
MDSSRSLSRRRALRATAACVVLSSGCLSGDDSTEPTPVQTTGVPPISDPDHGDFYVCVRNDGDESREITVTVRGPDGDEPFSAAVSLEPDERDRRKNVVNAGGAYTVEVDAGDAGSETVTWDIPESVEDVTGVNVNVEPTDGVEVVVAERQPC